MYVEDGVSIYKEASFGLILEKPYFLKYAEEILKNIDGISELQKLEDHLFGNDILYLKYKGKSVCILTAQGSSMAISAVERLKRIGVKEIIYIGTAGSLNASTIKKGDMLLTTAGVREEGATDKYLPIYVPALPDLNFTLSLKKELENLNVKPICGVTYTTDTSFKEDINELSFLNEHANVICIDMETSAVILVSSYHKISVAALNIVTDYVVPAKTKEPKGIDPYVYKNFIIDHLKLAIDGTLALLKNKVNIVG